MCACAYLCGCMTFGFSPVVSGFGSSSTFCCRSLDPDRFGLVSRRVAKSKEKEELELHEEEEEKEHVFWKFVDQLQELKTNV